MEKQTPLEKMMTAAKEAGCPLDQVRNFAEGGYAPQPKQWQFHAYARLADDPAAMPGATPQIAQAGSRGGAKALALDTPIPTIGGWKTMETLQPGDRVFAPDGTVTTVVGCSNVMTGRPCYEITFSDGAIIIADEGHLWVTFSKAERGQKFRRTDEYRERRRRTRPTTGRGLRPWLSERPSLRGKGCLLPPTGTIRSTHEICQTLYTPNGKEKNHAIFVAQPLQLPSLDLPIDPYVLGVWLGDGDSARGYITSADSEIISELNQAGFVTFAQKSRLLYRVEGFTTLLRLTGLTRNKHIPALYLRASYEQRLALLQGLMDTDGTVNKRGQCTFVSTRYQLIRGVWELILSLGIKARVRENVATLYGRVISPVWRIKFSSSIEVFRLPRKVMRQKAPKTNRARLRYITNVRTCPSVPVRCITVEHKSQCYLTSRNFIPTHNSHAAICQVGLDDCVRHPGLKCLFLRKVGKSARESFEGFLTSAVPSLLRYYTPSRGRVALPNGSAILLGGFRTAGDIANYLGLEYDVMIIDDAHVIAPEWHRLILGSLRTSKRGWRPRAYVGFNPGGVAHAYLKRKFVKPWRSHEETDTRMVFSLPEDNAFLNPEYRVYLDGLTGWLKQAWRYGDFDIAAGQFFTTWRGIGAEHSHVIEPFDIPRGWRMWCAMDYGFTHPTVVYLLAESDDGVVYVVAEHWEQQWLVPRHAEAIKAMLERNGTRLYLLDKFVAGPDVFAKRGTELTIAENYDKLGIKLTPANTDRISGAAECLARLGDVEAGIMPRVFIFNRCVRLIECLPAMQHDPHRPEDILKVNIDIDAGEGGDDAAECFRYGLMAAVPPPPPPGVIRYV